MRKKKEVSFVRVISAFLPSANSLTFSCDPVAQSRFSSINQLVLSLDPTSLLTSRPLSDRNQGGVRPRPRRARQLEGNRGRSMRIDKSVSRFSLRENAKGTTERQKLTCPSCWHCVGKKKKKSTTSRQPILVVRDPGWQKNPPCSTSWVRGQRARRHRRRGSSSPSGSLLHKRSIGLGERQSILRDLPRSHLGERSLRSGARKARERRRARRQREQLLLR